MGGTSATGTAGRRKTSSHNEPDRKPDVSPFADMAEKINWTMGTGEIYSTVMRGGDIPQSGPTFFTTDGSIADGYGAGRTVGLYKVDNRRILQVGSPAFYKTFGDNLADEYESLGPELYSDPPASMMSKLKKAGYIGYSSYSGSYIRIEEAGKLGIRTVEVRKSK